MIAAIAIKRRKKKIPVTIQASSSGGRFGSKPINLQALHDEAKRRKSLKVTGQSHIANRFECNCGHNTCQKFYRTFKERERHLAGVAAAKTNEYVTPKEIITKSLDRFECNCGYHTCQKFYNTENERKLHLAGVSAAKTKELQASKDKLLYDDIAPLEEKSETETTSTKGSMPKGWKRCPKCGKQVRTKEAIQADFGYRIRNGVKHEQSWCKECRTNMPDKIIKSEKKLKKSTHKKQESKTNTSKIEKEVEKDSELIKELTAKMVKNYLLFKNTINKDIKFKLIDSYLEHKSIKKLYEIYPKLSKSVIQRHLTTNKRLPEKLQELVKGSLHSDPNCSATIAFFVTDHYDWDGEKSKEEEVVGLANSISEYLEMDKHLNQVFQGNEISSDFTSITKQRDEIHKKYRSEHPDDWEQGDRTQGQFYALYGHKNLKVVEYFCRWEFEHKHRMSISMAMKLIDNPEKYLKGVNEDELL